MKKIDREDIKRAVGYPRPGDRIRVVFCSDAHTTLTPGWLGTVTHVDDTLTVHVEWDAGVRLGLIPGEDRWELLPRMSKPKLKKRLKKKQEREEE
jgi:hypothetical protein